MRKTQPWVTEGFESFSKGIFGNAGQNLYVSRAGVLQRIHQYDLNKNGYFDLVFCNDHDHGENAPTYVYQDVLGIPTRYPLPSDGAWTGAMADLNGDGFDDLVLGMLSNTTHPRLNAFVYFGAEDGFSERRKLLLPAPICISVAAGDFNGDGKPDLAFLCRKEHDSIDTYVRVFYQTHLGFEPTRYTDKELQGDQIEASDLDGDGYSELIVRGKDGEIRVYWGASSGLDESWSTLVAVGTDGRDLIVDPHYEREPQEARQDARPLVRVLDLDGVPNILVTREDSISLVGVNERREFGAPLELPCHRPVAAAIGDINGNGYKDLVVACREIYGNGECSWIYWGGEGTFSADRRTRLLSYRASDVVVADLNGDSYADIVLCQNRSLESYTTDSFVYRCGPNGVTPDPVRLSTEDARRVFVTQSTSEKSLDLVFVNHWSRNAARSVNSYVYFGGSDGFSPERRKEVPGVRAVGSVCCDVNDDGYVDLVIVNSSLSTVQNDSGSYVLLNGSDGFPVEPSIVLPTIRAHGIACADLNRDGYLDLIFGGVENHELTIFHGKAGGFDIDNPQSIRMEKDGVLFDDVRFMFLADLNNDGWLDLFVPHITYDRSFILWGGPKGFSMDRSQMLSIQGAIGAQAADLNGNGYADLIVGGGIADVPLRGGHSSMDGPHNSFLYIYWNGPDGLSEDRRTMLPANAPVSLAVADFNNDGLLDIFACSYHDGRVRDIDSYIYWNRPGRGFSALDRHRMFTHSAAGVVAADFNEDGWTDLAIAYHKINGDHVGNSDVWWNGPNGFLEGRITELPTLGPHGMVCVNPGNIMNRGTEEFYISAPFESSSRMAVTSISWDADVPEKTWVKAQLRCADTETGLQETSWCGPGDNNSWYENGQRTLVRCARRWFQYRLALGSTNSLSTPRVTQVEVHYEMI